MHGHWPKRHIQAGNTLCRQQFQYTGDKLEYLPTIKADALLNSRKLPLLVELALLFDMLFSKQENSERTRKATKPR